MLDLKGELNYVLRVILILIGISILILIIVCGSITHHFLYGKLS